MMRQVKGFLSQDNITKIVLQYTTKGRPWVKFNFNYLIKYSIDLAEAILQDPQEYLKAFNILISNIDGTDGQSIRFYNLPNSCQHSAWTVRNHHVGKFIALKGLVSKISSPEQICKSVRYECPSCGNIMNMLTSRNKIPLPFCVCGRKGSFKIISKEFVDIIKVGIVDDLSDMDNMDRTITREKMCILEKDLASKQIDMLISPGKKVIINGYLEYIKKRGDIKTEYTTQLISNYVEFPKRGWDVVDIDKKTEAKIKKLAKDPYIVERLAQSVVDVEGADIIKLACMLQLAGSPHLYNENKQLDSRGTIHILLIGDPGSAKSTIAKNFGVISPIHSYQSCANASGKGLVASVVNDAEVGGWVVYPGVVPLASEGIVVLDEMDKTHQDDYGDHNHAMNDMCYDDQTEILTEEGWKFFDDLEGDERVATLNQNHFLEYHKIQKRHKFQYSGDMIHLKNKQVDLLVTPEHRLFVQKRKWGFDWHDYKLQRACDVFTTQVRFKKNAYWKGKQQHEYWIPSIIKKKNQNAQMREKIKKVGMDYWLELMGWFISEGCVKRENDVPYRTIITQINPTNRKLIINTIKNLRFKYKINGKNICINNKQLAVHLNYLSKGARNKFVPSYIKKLSPVQIKLFLKTLVFGDGWLSRNRTGFCTSSPKLADDVQELLLKVGMSCNIKIIKPRDTMIEGRKIKKENKLQMYYMAFNKKQNHPQINHHQPQYKFVQYPGFVHCVTVKNHIIYIRRNGIPVWCGNSVPVAKANVKAVLITKTSYLATANPKHRVFSNYEDFYRQIDIPKDLMDRFDVIFPMVAPNDEKKKDKIMDIILDRHTDSKSSWKPEFEHDFIRKYVAYCRQNYPHPKIDKKFYPFIKKQLNKLMKPKNEDEHKISFRHMESILRFAYASALLRMDEVNEYDIKIAFKIKYGSFKGLGIIDEYGFMSFDVDSGVPVKERTLHHEMQDILKHFLPDTKALADIQEVVEYAKKKGLDEVEVDKYIDELLHKGDDFFSPRRGTLKRQG